MRFTTSISWVINRMVMPRRRLISLSSSRIERVVAGSSALVASSHSSTLGLLASARAIATRCFCPPERFAGQLSCLSDNPTRSSNSLTRFFICSRERLPNSNGSATLPETVREFIRLKCWKIMPIWRRASVNWPEERVVNSWPSTSTRPEVGRSSRLTQRIRVLLPAPEEPMTP